MARRWWRPRPAPSCWRSRRAAAAAVAGLLIEFVVIRKLYDRDHLQQVLATFGLILFINEGATILFGPSRRCSSAMPQSLSGSVETHSRRTVSDLSHRDHGRRPAGGARALSAREQDAHRHAGARRFDPSRHGARARRQYPAALYAGVRTWRVARRSRRSDGRTASCRPGRHGRADPDPYLCRCRDRRASVPSAAPFLAR